MTRSITPPQHHNIIVYIDSVTRATREHRAASVDLSTLPTRPVALSALKNPEGYTEKLIKSDAKKMAKIEIIKEKVIERKLAKIERSTNKAICHLFRLNVMRHRHQIQNLTAVKNAYIQAIKCEGGDLFEAAELHKAMIKNIYLVT